VEELHDCCFCLMVKTEMLIELNCDSFIRNIQEQIISYIPNPSPKAPLVSRFSSLRWRGTAHLAMLRRSWGFTEDSAETP
jgi:hypothetical protein